MPRKCPEVLVRRSFLHSVIVILCCVSILSFSTTAQTPTTKRAKVKVPDVAPRPEDVTTLDGIMKAFYETISGPAGQQRQWGRDRTLYIPGIRFVATETENGKTLSRVMDHQTYVDLVNDDFVRKGFFEREIHRITGSFGNITHVFSTYETRLNVEGPVTERGVNSVELFFDGKRWWIASTTWDQERPDNPIPGEFLP
jgi:hypothetical protein